MGRLLVVLTGMIMTTLELVPVSAAVPGIRVGLRMGAAAATLIVPAFGVTYAAALVGGGRLGDRYGRRRLFTIGLAVLTLASAACGLAPTPVVLLAGRVMQGTGGALLAPQVPALLAASFTGTHRKRAFRLIAVLTGVAAMFGQLLAGLLMGLGQQWRAVFLVNLPIGVLCLATVRWVLPRTPGAGRRTADPLGAFLLAVALGVVVAVLAVGAQLGWPAWLWPVPLLAIPPLLWLGYRHRAGRAAGEPPSLLRQRGVLVAVAISFCFFAISAGLLIGVVLYLRLACGMSAVGSGLALVPFGIGFFVMAGRAPALVARQGREVLSSGVLVLAVGQLLLALTVLHVSGSDTAAWLAVGLLVAGGGAGLVTGELSPIVLGALPPELAPRMVGLLSTIRESAKVLGAAAAGAVVFSVLGHGPRSVAAVFQFGLVLLALSAVGVAVLVLFLPSDEQA
ncbi:MAG TPA: MFS transporter [Pseudonocardiaceae bacterium]